MAVRCRPLREAELWDMNARSLIMMSLEVEHPRYVPMVVDKLIKSTIGFHIKKEGNNLVAHNDKVPILSLPKGYKNLKDLSNAFIRENYLDYEKAFAMIGCNETQVSFIVSHMCSDGGYLKYQMEHILDKAPKLDPLPAISASFFKKEIENAPSDVQLWASHPDVTRLLPRRNKCVDPGVDPSHPDYFTIEATRDQMKCYDKKIGKLRGLTEYYWLAHIFSAMAFNGRMNDVVGVTTCIDLRNWLPPGLVDKVHYNFTNGFSAITPISVLKPTMTLRDVGEQMRRDMFRRLDRGEQFGFMKGLKGCPDAEQLPGACLEITNMKSMIQKKPIVDSWCALSLTNQSTEQVLSVMSFGTEGYGKNKHVIRLRYGPSGFSKSDMNVFGKSFDHFMRNISLDRRVDDVFDEMRAFQASVH